MSMTVEQAIRDADAALPSDDDNRWKLVIAVGEFVESDPEIVWDFVRRWGGHRNDDLRTAIATCALEHLLEYHFDSIFPLVESAALNDPLYFGDTFRGCWKFGQSELPENTARFDQLTEQINRTTA